MKRFSLKFYGVRYFDKNVKMKVGYACWTLSLNSLIPYGDIETACSNLGLDLDFVSYFIMQLAC